MPIHTEVHFINNNNDIIVAQQTDNNVTIRIYDTPEDFAANVCTEIAVSYEFFEEILRVRKQLPK